MSLSKGQLHQFPKVKGSGNRFELFSESLQFSVTDRGRQLLNLSYHRLHNRDKIRAPQTILISNFLRTTFPHAFHGLLSSGQDRRIIILLNGILSRLLLCQ